MKSTNENPEERNLRKRLAEAMPCPALPPRFQESVWRRIEREDRSTARDGASWFEAFAGFVLRPRFAFAAAALLVVAGGLLGLRDGTRSAQLEAQRRYVVAVAPTTLH